MAEKHNVSEEFRKMLDRTTAKYGDALAALAGDEEAIKKLENEPDRFANKDVPSNKSES